MGDGEVRSEVRALQACPGAALLCHWRCKAPLAVPRDLRHRAGGSHGRGHHERHQDRLRLPPKYQETAAYCHFGREPYTKEGIKYFEWENAKDLSKYAKLNSAQVSAELKTSNYLEKWVD